MQEIILHIIEEYGYFGVFFLILIENIFPPIPSEVILLFSGFFSTYTNLKVFFMIIASTFGSLFGALILYYIGKIFNKERLKKIVRGKIISVEEKIEYIQNILTTADKISFNNIIKDNTKDEVIATFLSLLELIKSKEIVVVQENFFEDIIIKKNLEN